MPLGGETKTGEVDALNEGPAPGTDWGIEEIWEIGSVGTAGVPGDTGAEPGDPGTPAVPGIGDGEFCPLGGGVGVSG